MRPHFGQVAPARPNSFSDGSTSVPGNSDRPAKGPLERFYPSCIIFTWGSEGMLILALWVLQGGYSTHLK